MNIDIWSDIMCPFCYIGKRNLEAALAEFEGREDVQVQWHSFRLDPDLKPEPGMNVVAYLAARKGQSLAWSEQAHAQVTASARAVGLDYRFDKAVLANSWDAHRVLQLAKISKRDDALEELLFKAYFTDGRDVADKATLQALATEAGLDAKAVAAVLASEAYGAQVVADVDAAHRMGASGVPFFVLDQRLGVVGAQPAKVMLQALREAYMGWKARQAPPTLTQLPDGPACDVDGNCD